MRAVTFLMLLLSAASALAEVEQVADNIFRIERSDKAGIFGDAFKFRNEVIAEADEFAATQGKVAEKITLKERGPGFMRFAKVEYTFRLVDPEPEIEETGEPDEKPVDVYTEILKLDSLHYGFWHDNTNPTSLGMCCRLFVSESMENYVESDIDLLRHLFQFCGGKD